MSPRDKKAFTLIEILIVIAISAMLSSIALTYSGVARNQTALSVQTSEVAQTILFAKNLATAAYITNSSTCGYGVVFASSTYSIFEYTPQKDQNNQCPDVTTLTTSTISFDSNGNSGEVTEYSASTWKISLARGVQFQSAPDSLSVMLFYPPNPTTMLSTDPVSKGLVSFGAETATVYLETNDGGATAHIPVNLSGQISL